MSYNRRVPIEVGGSFRSCQCRCPKVFTSDDLRRPIRMPELGLGTWQGRTVEILKYQEETFMSAFYPS